MKRLERDVLRHRESQRRRQGEHPRADRKENVAANRDAVPLEVQEQSGRRQSEHRDGNDESSEMPPLRHREQAHEQQLVTEQRRGQAKQPEGKPARIHSDSMVTPSVGSAWGDFEPAPRSAEPLFGVMLAGATTVPNWSSALRFMS